MLPILPFCWLFVNIVLATPPNVIFFLADDLGYDDLGFQDDNQIHTPNIDKFKKEGQFLEWYYGQPLCSPTRSTIMTGSYPLHTGINTVIKPTFSYGVPLKFTFFPKILYENGYDTHAVGKWHLGFYKWSYTPTFRGFTSYYGYYNGEEDYNSHMRDGNYDFHNQIGVECGSNCTKVASEAKGQYSAFSFTNRAIEVINNHTNNGKNKPLFLYMPWQSVHGPCEVPSSYVNAYNKTINNQKRRNYAGMLSALDEGIGNITNVLQQNGYLNDTGNTIIIFSSDNGAPVQGCGGVNYPLRGDKSTIWEGGTRLTASIWGTPDIIPNSLRGNNYTQLMHTVDWFPTILEAAGIDITKYINYTIDGVSQWKGIIGDNVNDTYFAFRDTVWYGYSDNVQKFVNYHNISMRYRWNKLFNGTGGPKDGWYKPAQLYENLDVFDGSENYLKDLPKLLFNLSSDAGEHYDISSNNTEIVQQIVNMMYKMESTGVPQMENDTNCPPIIHPVNSVVGPTWVPWCGM